MAPLANIYGALVEPKVPPASSYGTLVDPTIPAPDAAPMFAQDTPLRAAVAWLRQPVVDDPPPAAPAEPQSAAAPLVASPPADAALAQNIPLPPPRPALLRSAATPRSSTLVAQLPTEPAAPPAGQPSFFERLFGGGRQPPGTALAYAPESGGFGNLLTGRPDTSASQTAVYDISTHTVVLPNGTRLEAHSGLGASHDDPNSVTQRMRGATPPAVYDLTAREALFHGVQALRLTPVGNSDTFGRGGLLAHSYMLGPRGDSNGCVVFKNYQAFLQAFETGQVKRLMVVARM